MLLQRCLTTLVLLSAVTVLLLFAPVGWVLLVIQIIACFALYDFFTHALREEPHFWQIMGIGMGVGVSTTVSFGGLQYCGLILALMTAMMLGIILFRFSLSMDIIGLAGKLLVGILYIGFLFSHTGLILTLPEGKRWIGLVVLGTAMVDIGAFCGGYFFGRKKLCPSISPNKTVEGAVGGMIGSLVGVMVSKFAFFPQLSPPVVVGLAVSIGILSQMGDLCESMLKRSLYLKDFGSYLPGHGGFLDRIDSLLFTAPFVFYVITFPSHPYP